MWWPPERAAIETLHTSAYVSIRQHTSAYVSSHRITISAYDGDGRGSCPIEFILISQVRHTTLPALQQ
jgi:hypothetical protein